MKWIDTPPVWLAGFAGAAWMLRGLGPELGAVGDVLGGILIALALLLVGLAAREFRRHRTTIIPHEIPKALITTGIYARSRNPIYLADAMILAGLALIWSASLALILVPAFMAMIQARFVLPEERRLENNFPAEYAAYAQQTKRWL
ncbi:S-isoprenylcysteine methyltransferase [Roseivivax halodurans JCM 10272]|uniref:S-isoprenylcysteine methyltransferase n=1 Tax=Roseivivax halodurans JCM 10272 TaxID=1449350 RepID=X7EKC5_9RHOB|nr:isoprenylcysteine carboxylmethyltransferase family protein [Roseivivax halodurans]ETX15626.1 S-isoprenylcysteine methyltransferase [Roseivivax halodurans JCM 10272]